MAVVVVPAETEMPLLTFKDGRGWHVDETLALHVRGAQGNVASFGPHRWAAVYDADSADTK